MKLDQLLTPFCGQTYCRLIDFKFFSQNTLTGTELTRSPTTYDAASLNDFLYLPSERMSLIPVSAIFIGGIFCL